MKYRNSRNSGFLILAGSLFLYGVAELRAGVADISQASETEEDTSALMTLIRRIYEDTLNSPDMEEPEENLEATDDYDERITEDVLDYLSSVYSQHGYYDSGGWAKVSPLELSRNDRKLSSTFSDTDLSRVGVYTPRTTELPSFLTEDFRLPIRGRLTSGYGYRPRFGRMHKGIDVSLHIGDTVRSALPGVVSKVSYEAKGYGNYVVITHSGGYETRYAHMSRCIVSPGDRVSPGDAVGLGGSTGNSTGPHLHFEIRYQGEALDPLSCFGLSEVYR